MISAAAGHAAGINWVAVAVNMAAVGGTICAILAFLLARLDRRRARHERWVTEKISEAVTRAGQATGARIDTLKSEIGEHMSHQDRAIDRLDRRTYRIETRLMRKD